MSNIEENKNLCQFLEDHFVNRRDCYCIQLEHGYSKVDEPLTDDVLKDHVEGKKTVGSYQLSKENLVKWLCFDLDPEKLHDPKEAALKILDVCFEEKEEADGKKRPRIRRKAVLLEASRYPDPSYHIWILFEPRIPAKVAKWLGLRILELSNLNPRDVEVFPKQTELTADRPFGNFVKLPLGLHQAEQKWSQLLHTETFEPLANESLLNFRGISFSEADLSKMMSFKQKTNVQTALCLPAKFKPLTSGEEEKVVNFLCRYWKPGYRNRLEISFLGLCLKQGVSYESAERIIKEVTARTGDEERQSRLVLVDYHYCNRLNIVLKGSSGIREIIRELKANEYRQNAQQH